MMMLKTKEIAIFNLQMTKDFHNLRIFSLMSVQFWTLVIQITVPPTKTFSRLFQKQQCLQNISQQISCFLCIDTVIRRSYQRRKSSKKHGKTIRTKVLKYLEVLQRKPSLVDSSSLADITSPTYGRNITSLNFACRRRQRSSIIRIITNNWNWKTHFILNY